MGMLIVTLIVQSVSDWFLSSSKKMIVSFLYPKQESFEKDFHLVDLRLGIGGLFSENRSPSTAGH